jgi:hypothetical protein
MKLAAILAASLALATPVVAQTVSGRIDWKKPVIGVDYPAPAQQEKLIEDVALPVEIHLHDSASALPPRPPCEEPVEKAPGDVAPPPNPAPCPQPR